MRTYTFLLPFQLSLPGLAKPFLLLGEGEKSEIPTEVLLAGWHPHLLSPKGLGQVCMVASGAPSTASLVLPKYTSVPTCPVATCTVFMVNAMQDPASKEKEARAFRWQRAGRFLSEVPHACSRASCNTIALPCTARTTIHVSFFLTEITSLLESYQ